VDLVILPEIDALTMTNQDRFLVSIYPALSRSVLFWPFPLGVPPPRSEKGTRSFASRWRGGTKHHPNAALCSGHQSRQNTASNNPPAPEAGRGDGMRLHRCLGAPGFLQERPGIGTLLPEGGFAWATAADRTFHGRHAMGHASLSHRSATAMLTSLGGEL